MITLENYFYNKKILVTGDTGFCGSWLTIFLTQLGAKVYGLSLYEKDKNIFHRFVKNTANYYPCYCDILNKKKTDDYIRKIKPNIIFHLAAQPLVLDSYKDFRNTLDTNLMGTFNILSSSIATRSVSQIIVITTDKVYQENNNQIPYTENMPLGGLDPYSASKSMVEILCKSFKNSIMNNKINLMTARGGNIIGGGDFAENRLIPDIIKNALINKSLVEIRNPNHIRPWQHVFSLCYAYILLSYKISRKNKRLIKEDSFNFGPNNHKFYSVEDIVKLLTREVLKISNTDISKNIKVKNKKKKSFYESKILKLNSKKANQLLGWKPYYNINQAIKETAEWYYAYSDKKEDILNYSTKKVNEFLKKIR